jgi:hypothetical protein
MMTSSIFWRTVISGILATFAMAMTAFLQGGFGLPVIDVGHILRMSFNYVHVDEPYSIAWGNLAYFVVGIKLALLWVAFLQAHIRVHFMVQGFVYGLLISLIAGLVVAPLASKAAGEPFGFFYADTWVPGLVILAGIGMHIAYGLVLSVCLKIAGVYGLK